MRTRIFLRDVLIATSAACALIAQAAELQAAKKPGKYSPNKSPQARSQQAKQAVQQAGQAIGNAQREVAAAAAQVSASKSKLRGASNEASHVRDEVKREHDSAAVLESSRRLSEEGQKKFEELRAPVLEKLARKDEYRAAVARRDSLLKELEGPNAGPKERREELEHDLAVARGEVHRIERAAIEADPKAKAALDELNKEQADLRNLVKARDENIDRDSRLNQAKDDVREAKAGVDSAQSSLAGAQRHLAQAQQNYVQKVAQAQRATANKTNNKRKYPNRR